MKKHVLLLAIMTCSFMAKSVEYEYMPLVEEGKVWVYDTPGNKYGADTECMMEFKGDTTINGAVFKKLYFYDTKNLTSPKWPIAYMCETEKKVYAIANEDMLTHVSNKHLYQPTSVVSMYLSGTEVKELYDFNDISSQKFPGIPSSTVPVVSQVEIDGKMWNKGLWAVDGAPDVELVEGIGPNSVLMTLTNPSAVQKIVNDGSVSLRGLKCVMTCEGDLIFKGCAYPEIEPSGVKDVNDGKSVSTVKYVSLSGVESVQPLNGFCVKVTTYTDGSTKSVKVVK